MSDSTTPQDGKAMSPASAGSDGPVSVSVHVDKSACGLPDIRPLRRPVPKLTDEEREAIETAAMIYEQGAKQMGHVEDGRRAVALRTLLERLG